MVLLLDRELVTLGLILTRDLYCDSPSLESFMQPFISVGEAEEAGGDALPDVLNRSFRPAHPLLESFDLLRAQPYGGISFQA